MIEKFLERFFHDLRKRQCRYIGSVGKGHVQDMKEYGLLCGKAMGLEEAEGIGKELYKEFFNEKILDIKREKEDVELDLYRGN